jgi:hypothetical protein
MVNSLRIRFVLLLLSNELRFIFKRKLAVAILAQLFGGI